MAKLQVGLVVVAGLLLSGCGSSSRVVEPEEQAGELKVTDGAMEGSDAYPAARDGTTRFKVSGGKDDGKVMVVERRTEGDVLLETWTIEGEKLPRFERTLVRAEDGSVAMREQRSFDRRVRSVFVPPLAVFPARLSAGASFTMSSRMTVHPIDKPKAIKEQGMARVEITLRGVQAPAAGREEAMVVRTVFSADLKSADVVRTTDRWFAPGGGVVREVYEETVKVFGVVVERTGETFSAIE